MSSRAKIGKKLVDGWVWAESFGRWIGGSAKPQIEHMYPSKYQVPPRVHYLLSFSHLSTFKENNAKTKTAESIKFPLT